MGDLEFHNIRTKSGHAWCRHAGWETLFNIGDGHAWSASELHYRFMRGASVEELSRASCNCGHVLSAAHVEAALRHEFTARRRNGR